ncbi:hypothetical protein [Daejeonella sp.]|uniref:hypothetical protein n=1 Tax=Daejeonella sp. TaxID=2805397 RepID=UPI0030BD92A1
MRNQFLILISLSALSIGIISCNREQPKKKILAPEKIVCYQSISGSDTAWLSIDTANTPFAGTLTFNYTEKKQLYEGKFTGKMDGDTLKGYYDFRINKENPAFRNPVALLKKDGKLTMGVGQFMTVMGTGEFDDRVPIDYSSARFVFEEVACKD